jgi:predicted NBD/HSP70 family sugar kinase
VAGPAASSAIREQNLRALLAVLRDHGPAARADIVARTGLSIPTVSAGLRVFEAEGLIREFGQTTGRRGPRASIYELLRDGVLVLGIDIGARHVRTVLSGLDGEVLEAFDAPLARPRADDVLEAVRALPAQIGVRFERVELAVVGTPGIVDPDSGRVGAAPNIDGWEGIFAADAVGGALGVPVSVENDVNLAALGEQARGAGRDVPDFAYLSVGTGVGAGIVVQGRLHRGARGAAGEVGFLPVGADPFDVSNGTHRGAMEAALSAVGVAAIGERLAPRHARDGSPGPPYDAEALFTAARAGDPLGRAVALETARQVAMCIAGMTAVLDLELVLLGGGVGANADLLLPDVRRALTELVPVPPRIEAATLGDRGVATGAAALGADLATERVIERILHAA